MNPIHFMIAAFSLYVDFWCGVGFIHGKVAHDQPLVHIFMLWSLGEEELPCSCLRRSRAHDVPRQVTEAGEDLGLALHSMWPWTPGAIAHMMGGDGNGSVNRNPQGDHA